jgi:hypothetical protein
MPEKMTLGGGEEEEEAEGGAEGVVEEALA